MIYLIFSVFLLPDIRVCKHGWRMKSLNTNPSNFLFKGWKIFLYVCAVFLQPFHYRLIGKSVHNRSKKIDFPTSQRKCHFYCGPRWLWLWLANGHLNSQYILKSNWKQNRIQDLEKIITLEMRDSVLWSHTPYTQKLGIWYIFIESFC